jgi:hypothetical protein
VKLVPPLKINTKQSLILTGNIFDGPVQCNISTVVQVNVEFSLFYLFMVYLMILSVAWTM